MPKKDITIDDLDIIFDIGHLEPELTKDFKEFIMASGITPIFSYFEKRPSIKLSYTDIRAVVKVGGQKIKRFNKKKNKYETVMTSQRSEKTGKLVSVPKLTVSGAYRQTFIDFGNLLNMLPSTKAMDRAFFKIYESANSMAGLKNTMEKVLRYHLTTDSKDDFKFWNVVFYTDAVFSN